MQSRLHRWLLGATLHNALEASMAGVYPMQGAKGLRSLAEANLLFAGTNAPILVVLDNVQADVVGTWEQVRELALSGEDEAANEVLLTVHDGGQGELRWLKELGRNAIRTGRLERLHIFGLSHIDAVCYSPAKRLLKAGRGWDTATAAYLTAVSDLPADADRPGPSVSSAGSARTRSCPSDRVADAVGSGMD